MFVEAAHPQGADRPSTSWSANWAFASSYTDRYRLLSMLATEYRHAERCPIGLNDEILGLLDNGVISNDDWRDLLKLDAVATPFSDSRKTGPSRWLCVAVAAILTASDVRRAARGAELLRRGLDCVIAVADGDFITPDAATLASDLGVRVLGAHPVPLDVMS